MLFTRLTTNIELVSFNSIFTCTFAQQTHDWRFRQRNWDLDCLITKQPLYCKSLFLHISEHSTWSVSGVEALPPNSKMLQQLQLTMSLSRHIKRLPKISGRANSKLLICCSQALLVQINCRLGSRIPVMFLLWLLLT